MKLYAATIRGFKYYFSGDLTPETINASERFCLKLEEDGQSANTTILFEHLINYIGSELGAPVTPVNIEHIFRINY